MPQATEELRAEWGIDDGPVIKWLQDRGWQYTQNWEWIKPSLDYKPTGKEIRAIEFLFQEWDWGGLADGQY